MMKGLMDRCLSHEMALERVRVKAKKMMAELEELQAWKAIQLRKLEASKQLHDELEKQTEALRKVLEDKEKEIADSKDQLRRAKEDPIQEYCDSDALLTELGTSFADGFDDWFRQVKASYPDLDLSHISIDPQAQTPGQPVYSKSTNKLFNNNTIADLQGEVETSLATPTSPAGDHFRPVDGDQETRDEEN